MCQGPGAVSYTDIAQGVKTCLGLSNTVVEFSGLYSMPTCPVALGFKKLHWLYVWDKTVPGSISTRVPVLLPIQRIIVSFFFGVIDLFGLASVAVRTTGGRYDDISGSKVQVQ